MSRSKKGGGTPADDRETAKQERAAQRAAREEEAVRRRKRKVLRKRLINAAIVVVVVAAIAAFFIPRKGTYTPGSSGASIEGVQLFQNPTGHTLGAVTYPQTPPAGGEHNPTWLNCGQYGDPVPNTYAVHSLEHGAVWVTYDPTMSADALATLREYLPSTYVVLSPYVGLPSPIVLTSWNTQLRLNSPDDPRLPRFFEEYWRSQNVPEPGALCTGGIDGPGRIS